MKEKQIRIGHGDTGFTYESLFGEYLKGVKEITVEDPYIRVPHHISPAVMPLTGQNENC